MITKAEIEFNIESINDMFLEYIEYIDSISFTDSNEREYETSDTLINNVKKASFNSIQYLEELKKDSLTEFILTTKQDTTLFNLCFEIYSVVNDDNFDRLITANDLEAYNRNDINPNSPIIKKGTQIIYYK
jgi:hypothetical protein